MKKNPIVFTDFHHASLLQSLILLFEKRLNGKVFRPIGAEWHQEGFWKVYDHPATVQQFLGVGANTPDGSAPLNEVKRMEGDPYDTKNPMIYHCHDIDSGTTNKAITLAGFYKLPIDIVIASIPDHIEPFKRLCESHPNKPKLIYQIGNAWDIPNNAVANVMASAIVPTPPIQVNIIEYHQEFNTRVFDPPNWLAFGEDWRHPAIVHPSNKIASFVNVFNGQSHFSADWQLFQEVERAMPEWDFKSHGGQCRDGAVGPSDVLASTMRSSRFIWHTKAGGDGYGHIIHNVAAVGRPLIVKKEYYRGKLGDNLLIDGETCIAIDNLSVKEIVDKINYYNDPERYAAMCSATYENFQCVCNFDEEFKDLQKFLENLS